MSDNLSENVNKIDPRLADAVSSLWAGIQNAVSELKELRERTLTASETIRQMKRELEICRHDSDKLMENATSLTAAVADKDKYIESLTEQILSLEEELKRYESIAADYENLKLSSSDEGVRLEALKAQADKLNALQLELSNKDSEIDKLNEIIGSLKRDAAEFPEEGENPLLESEYEKLKEDNMRLTFEMIQKDELILELHSQISTLSQLKDVEPQLFGSDEKQIFLMKKEISALQNELNQKNEALKKLNSSFLKLDSEKKRTEEDFVHLLEERQKDLKEKSKIADELDSYLNKLEKYIS